ncbi:hypothetical protein LINPERPRIM_LOCUS9659 [Linum perenne]
MAASNAETEKKTMRMKLLVDKKENRVVFAECSNDFVDFLFNLLSLPLSGIIKLISTESMVGSVGSIYQSLEDLQQSLFNPNFNKKSILTPDFTTNLSPLIQPKQPPPPAVTYNNSAYGYGYDYHRTPAPTPTPPAGIVKELTSFMVMDDLRVSQLSIISALTLLNKFGCKDIGALEEKEVEFGIDEARELLKECLQSKQVLTNVFLVKKKQAAIVKDDVVM